MLPTPSAGVDPLLDLWGELKSAHRERTLFEFADDPIAAAVGSYNNWQRGGNRWLPLSDVRISQEDREQADALRQYYTARLTMQALRGRPMTDFRKKFYAILNNQYQLTTDDIGLLMRLPYFYAEDIETDSVIANTVSAPPMTHPIEVQEKLLTPLCRILISNKRRGEFIQFWWRDQHNHGVVIGVRCSDPLFSLIDSLYDRPRSLSAKFAVGKHAWHTPQHNYYKMLQPRIT